MSEGDDVVGTGPGRLHAIEPAPDGAGALMTGLPFGRELGMRLVSARDGVAELLVPWDKRLVGDPGRGIVHGGVITALLDTACGWAVMSAPGRILSTATLDLRIDYMRPARKGAMIRARAECHRLTRSIAFARALAFHDDPAEPVATAQGAFIIERPDGRAADSAADRSAAPLGEGRE